MVQCFPSICLLNTEGQPVAWSMMDSFGAMGHGYTLPSFRRRGYSTLVRKALSVKLHAAGYPVYGHVAQDNVVMQKALERDGQQRFPDLFHICVHSKV